MDDLIKREDVINTVNDVFGVGTTHSMIDLLSDITKYQKLKARINELPSANAVSGDELHDGCYGCRYEHNTEYEYPCKDCKQNYMDKWERKTNDMVEVVRCKDCKWAEEAIIDTCVKCSLTNSSRTKYGYCHNGERREP